MCMSLSWHGAQQQGFKRHPNHKFWMLAQIFTSLGWTSLRSRRRGKGQTMALNVITPLILEGVEGNKTMLIPLDWKWRPWTGRGGHGRVGEAKRGPAQAWGVQGRAKGGSLILQYEKMEKVGTICSAPWTGSGGRGRAIGGGGSPGECKGGPMAGKGLKRGKEFFSAPSTGNGGQRRASGCRGRPSKCKGGSMAGKGMKRGNNFSRPLPLEMEARAGPVDAEGGPSSAMEEGQWMARDSSEGRICSAPSTGSGIRGRKAKRDQGTRFDVTDNLFTCRTRQVVICQQKKDLFNCCIFSLIPPASLGPNPFPTTPDDPDHSRPGLNTFRAQAGKGRTGPGGGGGRPGRGGYLGGPGREAGRSAKAGSGWEVKAGSGSRISRPGEYG